MARLDNAFAVPNNVLLTFLWYPDIFITSKFCGFVLHLSQIQNNLLWKDKISKFIRLFKNRIGVDAMDITETSKRLITATVDVSVSI